MPGCGATELASTITDQAVIGAMGDRFNFKFLDGEDVASAICYAIGEPANCSVSEIVIRPSEQE